MSADNWTQCPKCLEAARTKHIEAIKRAADAYGKLPAAEYEQLREAAAKATDVDHNFREDYGIGLTGDSTKFYAEYYGWCQDCDYKIVFKREMDLAALEAEQP